MKALILGASGMAGHTIALYFVEQQYTVTTLTRKPLNIGENVNMSINYNTITELNELIVDGNYDVIINCIGILNTDAEKDKESAVFLNSYLPHYLSKITSDKKTKIIQMSTDCVFSGREGNYTESSFTDGETFYDRSKALGELNDSKNVTFRNSIIGPDINEKGIGLFNWFMKQEGQINGFNQAIWTGVTTLTLAKAMDAAIKQDITGLYNLVNNQKISKYEMLQEFNDLFKANSLEIVPDNKLVIDKSLINTREDFKFTVPSYREMFMEMKEWINEHSEKYDHYLIDTGENYKWKN